MDAKTAWLYAKGYSFLARNMLAGKVVNKTLDALAWLDYRLLIYLSMWHPDYESRMRLLRKRGVQIGEHSGVDLGVWIEMTTPRSVIIGDYVGIGYGSAIIAHDASVNILVDLPMRVKPTRIGDRSILGYFTIVMPGVQIGEYCGVVAGSVVTKDVPDGTVVAGNPARKLFNSEDIILAWQEDMKVHPELYYDHPNPLRPPSSPYDHLVKWREEGVKIQDWTRIRTGTPFDHILEAKLRHGKIPG
ncbi:MAG: acyltransferase [Actinobacteria bacterium]|jgi:acetyltransferase-like isoleucine patch superfamily enzyme|nr:MAG: acyltransferase [Actinomycetota bacterium]